MTLRHFSIGMFRFVRRPVSEAPLEGVPCFADNGDDKGWSDRAVAVFSAGAWSDPKGRPLKFAPTHWTELAGVRK